MDSVAEALNPSAPIAWAWRAIVWASASYLIVLGALIFLRPSFVHRFFDGFVGTPARNALEAALRFVIGLAFIAVSRATLAPALFFWFGALLAATAIPMLFLYALHKRAAAWAVPFAKRILPLMGVCALAFGAFILWASLAG